MAERVPKGIAKIYRTSWFDPFAFGYMLKGIRDGMTDKDAAEETKKCLGLDEDTAPTHTLLVNFYRTREKFKEAMRDDYFVGSTSEDNFIEELAKKSAIAAFDLYYNLNKETDAKN